MSAISRAPALRALLWLAAIWCAVLAVILTPMHWIDVPAPRLIELASFTPLGTPFALVSLLLAVLLLVADRSRRVAASGLTTAVAAILALHVWWLAPLYVGHRPVTTGDGLTVFSQNFEYGDVTDLAQLVRAQHVDVLVLTDIGSERIAEVLKTDIPSLLPYSIGTRPDQTISSVIFSRFPMDHLGSGSHSTHADTVRLHTPSLGEVTLVAVHPQPPYTARWRIDYRALTAYLRVAVPQPASQPTVIAGDFNATTDNVPFRHLLDLGFTDALTDTRGGFQPTWPDSSARRYFGVPVPRLVTIDHILTSAQLAASRFTTVHVRGSDHSGIVAHLASRVN